MTSDILQAASLYVDVAQAQISGGCVWIESDCCPPISHEPVINLERAQALIASGIDNLKRGGK